MTVLDRLAAAVLQATKRSKKSLADGPVECSELLLAANNAGEFMLSFQVLGQDFQLMKQGVFTFNELGEAFGLEPNFEASLMRFLEWRVASLEAFDI
jgi:hypothetical protein